MIVRRKYIQEIAEKVLADSKTTAPPVPVDSIVRARGITITTRAVEKNVSGFLYRNVPGAKAIIGVNNAQPAPRRRFTMAHELGHFLLHANDAVHVDDLVKLRDERSAKGTDIQEMEANLFAAELLMPQRFLREDLRTFGRLDLLDEQKVETLARKYGVSNQAMAVRLSYLGHLAI